MIRSLFNDIMDIHTSRLNLLFPYHENENAIAIGMKECPLDQDVCKLAQERETARKNKDWQRADEV